MPRTYFTLVVLVSMLGIALLGCSRNDAEKQRLQAEKVRLERQLQISQAEAGYWKLTTGGLAIGSVVIFCVGMAAGMKVKKPILDNEIQKPSAPH